MRYNILGFDQLKASKLGLTLDELMLLRHLHDFASSGKMDRIIVDGEVYYWVKYDKFIEDLPILGMKKARLMEVFNNNLCVKPTDWEDRYNKMSESSKKKAKSYKFAGILKNYTKKDAAGTYSYFAFTELFYSLLPNITSDDDEMKKASVVQPTEASEKSSSNKNKSIDNISYSKKKDNSKNCKKESYPNCSKPKTKVKSNSFNNGTNNNFANYEENDLGEILKGSQVDKFPSTDRIKEALYEKAINNWDSLRDHEKQRVLLYASEKGYFIPPNWDKLEE